MDYYKSKLEKEGHKSQLNEPFLSSVQNQVPGTSGGYLEDEQAQGLKRQNLAKNLQQQDSYSDQFESFNSAKLEDLKSVSQSKVHTSNLTNSKIPIQKNPIANTQDSYLDEALYSNDSYYTNNIPIKNKSSQERLIDNADYNIKNRNIKNSQQEKEQDKTESQDLESIKYGT